MEPLKKKAVTRARPINHKLAPRQMKYKRRIINDDISTAERLKMLMIPELEETSRPIRF